MNSTPFHTEINGNKKAKIGFDGKPIKTIKKSKRFEGSGAFRNGQPKDFLNHGCFQYRKIEGCP